MSKDPHPHFVELRRRINRRLRELSTAHAASQIEDFPWLYGALGQVPSHVMFICENPSLSGVRKAHVETLDGGPPDIEAQWCGGPASVARKRFRQVLCELGLKSTPLTDKGGWACYITNVVKEANIVTEQSELAPVDRRRQTEDWADILRWELEAVQPETVFTVGGRATNAVRHLMQVQLLPRIPVHKIWHYSARGADDTVRERMRDGIREALGSVGRAAVTLPAPRGESRRIASDGSPRGLRTQSERAPVAEEAQTPTLDTLGAAIPELWSAIPSNRNRHSRLLRKVILRKTRENPRDPVKRGAGYRAWEVALSGITTEEYIATLEELWIRRPAWNQREKTPQLWKHLDWDLKKGHVRLVPYGHHRVASARAESSLPALTDPVPEAYQLVNEELLGRILGRGGRGATRRVRF